MVDVFITLLSMGLNGYKKLLEERMSMKLHLEERMAVTAHKHGLQVLSTKNNPISIGKMRLCCLNPSVFYWIHYSVTYVALHFIVFTIN